MGVGETHPVRVIGGNESPVAVVLLLVYRAPYSVDIFFSIGVLEVLYSFIA